MTMVGTNFMGFPITEEEDTETLKALARVTLACVHEVAQEHIFRYTARINAANRGEIGFRLDECERLLDTWQEVATAVSTQHEFDATKLSPTARGELFEALASEGLLPEFDE